MVMWFDIRIKLLPDILGTFLSVRFRVFMNVSRPMQCVVGNQPLVKNFKIKIFDRESRICFWNSVTAFFWNKVWNQPLRYLLLWIKKDIKGSVLNIASQSLKKTAKFRGKVEEIYLTGNEYHFNTCHFMYYSNLQC